MQKYFQVNNIYARVQDKIGIINLREFGINMELEMLTV